MNRLHLWACYVPLFVLMACEGGEDAVSAKKLINNPNSAATTEINTQNLPQIVFADPVHNFGKVKAGTDVKHTFTFTNKGKAPLVITNAYGSCGCTVADFPKNPIASGKSGEISVVFDTKGKQGQEIKYVSVVSNANPAITELTLKGEVTN